MDLIKSQKWFSIDKELQFTEQPSLIAAAKATPLFILLEKEGVWINSAYSNFAYDVEFYNTDGYKIDSIILGKWRISNISMVCPSDSWAKSISNVTIVDPWASSKTRQFGLLREGIRSAILFLQSASQFSSWVEFEQASPAEKELSQIHLLQEEIRHLKFENESLKCKIESMRTLLVDVEAKNG